MCFAGVNTIRTEAGYLVAASINVPRYLCGIESNLRLHSSISRIREKTERPKGDKEKENEEKEERRKVVFALLLVRSHSQMQARGRIRRRARQ